MAKEFSRTLRVGEQIRREIAQLIQQEIKDPRVGMVTVTAVDISPDMSHAKVHVTLLGDDHEVDECIKVLNRAAAFLRRSIGKRMKLRVVPTLRFHYDASVEQGTALSALIDSAVAADEKNRKKDQDGTS
ncbi:MAG TPA: 30S ribosome-binding factor RbfA [Chromatiales bacterium]|nr:30S ribosome-binding factor RbfA [Chromatiales bacterium]